MNDWIAVEEKLPDYNLRVLTVCVNSLLNHQKQNVRICFRHHTDASGENWYETGAEGLFQTVLLGKKCGLIVTHWQPLPRLPKLKGAKV